MPARLKTVIIFIIVGLSLIVLLPLSLLYLLFSFLRLKKPLSTIIYRMAQRWSLFLIKLTGCEVTVRGGENIPKEGPVCFVCNHGSIFDIVLLLAYAGRPVGFVGKKELLLIPFLNIWIFLLGGLFIDRKNPRKAVRTIDKGIRHIREGHAMLIFPEGSRSRGKGLLPFHVGSFKLATKSESIIIPASIAGSYEVFEKNYVVHSAPVSVSFSRPIETAGLSAEQRRQNLSDRVYAAIAESLTNASPEREF